MTYYDLAEDVLRRVHGGDIPDSPNPGFPDAMIAVAEMVPYVVYEDYKERLRYTGERKLTDDGYTVFLDVPVFEDQATDQRYALLPHEPAIISQDAVPRVEFMKDRSINFVYRNQASKGALERLNIAAFTGDIPFYYERVGWEHRLILDSKKVECAQKLKVSMVIASIDPNCIDEDTQVSLPGRLIALVKDASYKYLTSNIFKDQVNDNQ